MIERYMYYQKDGECRLALVINERANIFDVCLHNAQGQPGKIITVHRRDLHQIESPNIREILSLPPYEVAGGLRGGSIPGSGDIPVAGLPPCSAGGNTRGGSL
jgi:hypothetical protein